MALLPLVKLPRYKSEYIPPLWDNAKNPIFSFIEVIPAAPPLSPENGSPFIFSYVSPPSVVISNP